MAGAPKFVESQCTSRRRLCGIRGEPGPQRAVLKDPEELADAWRDALSADRPTVLDVYTDPDMPPIPPHATWEQFKATTAAVLAGDEDRVGFVKMGLKTKAQEFLPHKNS